MGFPSTHFLSAADVPARPGDLGARPACPAESLPPRSSLLSLRSERGQRAVPGLSLRAHCWRCPYLGCELSLIHKELM